MITILVPRAGFEPATLSLEVSCSIQLSYQGISYNKVRISLIAYKIRKFGAGGENRTLVLSLENLYTSRCTTPAVAPLYQYLYLLAST
jgi:hypothetical protein